MLAALGAAARRFALLLLAASVVTGGISLVLGALAGSRLDRAVSVGFYLGGSFVLVAAFFVGNRGPVRVVGDGSHLPIWGRRAVRRASREEQHESINLSAVLIAIGLAMVAIGVIVDGRNDLF
jgi:hypothetical protein